MTDNTADTTTPSGRWEFDEDVTSCFDDMLERSIPGYHDMRRLVTRLAERFIEPGTEVVDLGASRGQAVAPLVERFGNSVTWHLVEMSGPMLDALRTRFADWPEDIVRIQPLDLRTEFPAVKASVVLSILTLQFTPIEYRHRILRRVREHLRPGGVFIMVEKILGSCCDTDTLLTEEYYRLKGENGYSQQQIERKRLSLEGVLVPVTADWNCQLLKNAGFDWCECFWRCLSFAGWIARVSSDPSRP